MEETETQDKEVFGTRPKPDADKQSTPPSPERLREMLGWKLIEAERKRRIE